MKSYWEQIRLKVLGPLNPMGAIESTARPVREQTAEGGSSQARHALEGVVVLDLGQYLAGPFGPMILADLGAEVIKVEPVTGDAMRLRHLRRLPTGQAIPRPGPPKARRTRGARPARKTCRRRPPQHDQGNCARLGVDEDTLRRFKPDLIYCNTYAYGAEGPLSHSGGLDPLYQAMWGSEYEAGPVHAGNPPSCTSGWGCATPATRSFRCSESFSRHYRLARMVKDNT